MRINVCYSMNIGVYSQKIINQFHDFLMSKKNINENKCLYYKSNGEEDYIFSNDPNNQTLDNFNIYNGRNNHLTTGPTDYYGLGTPRIVWYYPNIDLYKIKANWGQGTWTLNV